MHTPGQAARESEGCAPSRPVAASGPHAALKTVLRYKLAALCLLAALLPMPLRAQDQAAQLLLRLRRNWGYGGFGEIQGNFSLTVSGPEGLDNVTFLLDQQVVAEVGESPWTWGFQTGQFSPGNHVLQAVGHLGDGTELRSNEIRVRFLSDAQATRATVRVVVVLLGAVGGLLALAGMVTLWLSRGRRGRTEPEGGDVGYGLLGGAVCPKCGRPFDLHWWAPNAGALAKLDRCPHCGHWSRVKRTSARELRLAQGLEAEETTLDHVPTLTEQEQLRRDLEDSRYTEL
jgi:Zn ribbon nucleic-acid-binding protein